MLAAQMCSTLSHFFNVIPIQLKQSNVFVDSAVQGNFHCSSGCITICEHVRNDVSPAEMSLLGCCELGFTGRLLLLLDAVAAEWRVLAVLGL